MIQVFKDELWYGHISKYSLFLFFFSSEREQMLLIAAVFSSTYTVPIGLNLE